MHTRSKLGFSQPHKQGPVQAQPKSHKSGCFSSPWAGVALCLPQSLDLKTSGMPGPWVTCSYPLTTTINSRGTRPAVASACPDPCTTPWYCPATQLLCLCPHTVLGAAASFQAWQHPGPPAASLQLPGPTAASPRPATAA